MNRLVIFLSFFLMVFTADSALSAKRTVLAVVGKKKITLKEFNRRYNEVKKVSPNPPPKKLFLEDLVRFEVGVQEAEKKNIARDPIVEERIRQELYKGLIEKEIGSKINEIQVSDAEMKRFYKNSPEIRTSHILIEVRPDATRKQRAAARKRAQEIIKEVRKSKRAFSELVALYTDDIVTKKTGGDIGWQSRISFQTLDTRYYDAAIKLRKNQISSLVETRHGFHIIKLTGRRSYNQANKLPIRASIFDKKKKVVFDNYFKKLKRQYSIKVNSKALN
jgi:parvulin-like peptidyl-prolyl isomerase